MAMCNSYVKLPEGKYQFWNDSPSYRSMKSVRKDSGQQNPLAHRARTKSRQSHCIVPLSFLQRASRFEEDIKNHQKGKRVLWKEHFQHGTP